MPLLFIGVPLSYKANGNDCCGVTVNRTGTTCHREPLVEEI